MASEARRRPAPAICFVLGMHRSGTSLLAHCLHAAGGSLPGETLAAVADNPRGYAEPAALVALNNQILQALDRPWFDDRPIDPGTLKQASLQFEAAAVELLQGWLAQADATLVLKDPRLCRLLPLWLRAAAALGARSGAVLSLRHAPEVAASLARRASDPATRPAAIVQPERAYLLWLQYLLEAEHASRGLPRALISHADLMQDAAGALARSLPALAPIGLPARTDLHRALLGLVEPGLHRNRVQAGDDPQAGSSALTQRIYALLTASASAIESDQSRAELDALRASLIEAHHDYSAWRDHSPAAPVADSWAPKVLTRALGKSRLGLGDLSGKRVVFVSGAPESKGHIYRVSNAMRAMQALGIETRLCDSQAARLDEQINGADALWVYRQQWNPALARLYGKCREQHMPVYFDIDDLIFDPRYMQEKYFDYLRRPEIDATDWQGRAQGYAEALRQADFGVFPTHPLACAASALQNRNFVHANGLGQDRPAGLLPQARAAGGCRLGYASGTPTHQRDFAGIVEPLAAVLEEDATVSLCIVGHLDLTEFPRLQPYASRIEQRDAVPFAELPAELARFDINLAPLEAGNPFCEAKSELKFFEAASVGVPTVASATEPYRQAIVGGQTGFVCESHSDWITALQRLIRDASLREQIGAAARRQVDLEYRQEAQSASLRQILQPLTQGPPA